MSPQYDSVAQPPRLPLVVPLGNRGSSSDKDSKLVNCYMETSAEGELFIYKRPGLADAATIVPNQPGRGIYFWDGHVYSIYGNTLFKDGVAIHAGLDTTGGIYRWDSNLGATPKLMFGNGKAAYSVDPANVVLGPFNTIDSDYPAVTVKGFAYLGGYSFVMEPTAYIHSELNSVDTATSWDPTNFIRAQIEPDQGVFLAKQLVYVVAFKQWSTEFFFLQGNPVGSPLGSVQGMKIAYGCANQDSVRSIDDVLFWLSTNRNASLQVMTMNQGATEIISTPAVDRLLANADISVVYSWNLKITGHSFYVLTFPNNNITIAYDIVMKQWFYWSDVNGNYFQIIDCTYDANGRHILQHATNGHTYFCDVIYYKDLDDPIVVDIITPIFDAATRRRKQLNMLEVIADQTAGSTLLLRCNDSDYKLDAWTDWRKVDLSVDRPMLTNCGTFVKRAYHLRHTANTPFRIQALEVQYDLGTL